MNAEKVNEKIELLVDKFLKESNISVDEYVDMLYSDKTLKEKWSIPKSNWLKISIDILENAHKIYREKTRKKILIGICIQLSTDNTDSGLNFTNAKELSSNFATLIPRLFFSRRKKIVPSIIKLQEFILPEYNDFDLKFLFCEYSNNKYKIDYRTVYITKS